MSCLVKRRVYNLAMNSHIAILRVQEPKHQDGALSFQGWTRVQRRRLFICGCLHSRLHLGVLCLLSVFGKRFTHFRTKTEVSLLCISSRLTDVEFYKVLWNGGKLISREGTNAHPTCFPRWGVSISASPFCGETWKLELCRDLWPCSLHLCSFSPLHCIQCFIRGWQETLNMIHLQSRQRRGSAGAVG